MTVSEGARQVAPLKWQLLSLFSVSEAIIVGFISSFYKSKTVMSAALSTAVATMSVTMYTLLNKDSKRDLSQWGAGLSSMGMIFVFYGILHLLSMSGILPPEFLPFHETVYSFLGASLFTLYLAYHTRLVVSGKHSKYQLNEKDYVFGAVLLYNDIISIFLYMLRLMHSDDKE
jgi:FtsH-binding integral membrane protein